MTEQIEVKTGQKAPRSGTYQVKGGNADEVCHVQEGQHMPPYRGEEHAGVIWVFKQEQSK
jgi:YjzC-like protein